MSYVSFVDLRKITFLYFLASQNAIGASHLIAKETKTAAIVCVVQRYSRGDTNTYLLTLDKEQLQIKVLISLKSYLVE